MSYQDDPLAVDPNEAPPGHYAIAKSKSKPSDGSNICRSCDWRPQCNGRDYRCTSYQIETDDGQLLKRKDGCSVVFKKKV